jgi:hypothetical protein
VTDVIKPNPSESDQIQPPRGERELSRLRLSGFRGRKNRKFGAQKAEGKSGSRKAESGNGLRTAAGRLECCGLLRLCCTKCCALNDWLFPSSGGIRRRDAAHGESGAGSTG